MGSAAGAVVAEDSEPSCYGRGSSGPIGSAVAVGAEDSDSINRLGLGSGDSIGRLGLVEGSVTIGLAALAGSERSFAHCALFLSRSLLAEHSPLAFLAHEQCPNCQRCSA